MTFNADPAAIDMSLAVACERGERDGLRRCLERAREHFPHLGIDVHDVAGGMAGYCGTSGFLSEATAIGVEHDVTRAEIDQIIDFYASKRCNARVVVAPVCHPDLGALLARAGFEPVEYQNTLVARVDELHGEHDARITDVSDPEAWAHASARAFCDSDDPPDELLGMTRFFPVCGAKALEARVDGQVVATACYAFEAGGVAALFAAGTLPAHRRQGWQRAMIRERIARAQEAGMRFARVGAVPLSASERNFRALGFTPLYTRTTWEKRFS